MKDTSETSIIGYTCPLCGKWHDVKYYYVGYTIDGIEWYHDVTPCCRVVVCWAKMDEMFIYVGSFRNQEDCENWRHSAGAKSHDVLAGATWNVQEQKYPNDIVEIPF